MAIITDTKFIHSTRVEDRKAGTYCTIVKEKLIDIDTDTDEIVNVRDNLKYYDNINRDVYITKPQYRTHKFKKFAEKKQHCDMYTIPEAEMVPAILKILNDENLNRIFRTRKYLSLKQLFNNPYIYNADVSADSVIRDKYNSNKKSDKFVYTFGGLDIETSVQEHDFGTVLANSVMISNTNTVYCAVYDDYFYHTKDGKRVKATPDDVYQLADELIGDILKEHGIQIKVAVCKDERDVIAKPISKIHEYKTDFMGIWNIAYDIPHIQKRCRHLNMSEYNLFCHPDVPRRYRVCTFREDKSTKRQHIADKWHWFSTSSYTQFYDSMLLYARKRHTDGKGSFALNDIAQKVLGLRKLKTTSSDHSVMQQHHFVEYVVYNILDAVLVYLIEKKVKDVIALLKLSGLSAIKDFAYQTIKLRDMYAKYCLDSGYVFATCGKDMRGDFDNLFHKAGGAVLKASNIKNIGLYCVKEIPNHESKLLAMCGDIDFEAMYPNMITAFGLSKENKLATIASILDCEGNSLDKNKVEEYCGLVCDTVENAIHVGKNFYGLPSYSQMLDRFDIHLSKT